MSSTSWKDTAELIGIAAIVASLVFVGMQMRQDQEIARATLYQMRSDAAREARAVIIDPALVDESMAKLARGEELSPHEFGRIQLVNGMLLSHFENSHYLYQLGFVPEEQWVSDKFQLGQLLQDPVLANYWKSNRQSFRQTFARELDALLEQPN